MKRVKVFITEKNFLISFFYKKKKIIEIEHSPFGNQKIIFLIYP